MKTIRVSAKTTVLGSRCEKEFQIKDDATDDEIHDLAFEEARKMLDWGWVVVEESASTSSGVGLPDMTLDSLWTIKNVMNEVTGLSTCHTGNAEEMIAALRREGFLLVAQPRGHACEWCGGTGLLSDSHDSQ